MEKWKFIKNLEGICQISNYGNIRTVDREINCKSRWGNIVTKKYHGKQLTPFKGKDGYLRIVIQTSEGKYRNSIHRLVAETFIPNPENKPCVGHNDCNPLNNCVENLYWCTYEENNNHPITKERQKRKIVSDESRTKMSLSQKKRFETETPWNKGKHCTEEQKDKISNANSKQIFQYTLDNKLIAIYKSSVIASEKTGFPQAQINKYAHGKYFSKFRNKWYYGNTYKGYKWSFEPL